MAERLVEIVLPESRSGVILEMLEGQSIIGKWRDTESQNLLLQVLIPAERTERLLDQLQERFSEIEGFSVILLPVALSLPHDLPEARRAHFGFTGRTDRISRDELAVEAEQSIRMSPIFIGMTVLSTIVASVGLLNDNLVVVLGAMMIAPLLAPNVTLALGTTLGDISLIRDSLRTNFLGVFIALVLSVTTGLLFPVDPTTPALELLTAVDSTDLLLALAAGAASTLAFTSGLPSALIGVIVAVALLPPLVSFGLLLGGGYFGPASGAFLLLVSNVVCVNLAGVLTFLIQGVRPRTWWEAEKARSATRIATAIWAGLLTLLAVILFLSQPIQGL